MTPDASRTNPTRRGAPRITRRTPGAGGAEDSQPAIRELSAATHRYARERSRQPPPKTTLNVPLALMAALIVGIALTLVGPSEYLCNATFLVAGDDPATRLATHRKELFDFALRSSPDAAATAGLWVVDSPEPHLLRISLKTADRLTGAKRVEQVAQAYLAVARDRAEKARATPTEIELILSEYGQALAGRSNDARAQLESSLASLPQDNPQKRRDRLLKQWTAGRSRFSETRGQLAAADATLARLKDQPPPTHGIVPADERHAALQADDALQQDLRELHVNLSELKAYLLGVVRDASPLLEQLDPAVEELCRTAAQRDSLGLPAVPQDEVRRLASNGEEYRSALASFTDAWNSEFTTLGQLVVDPLTGEVLLAHQHLRSTLNDFLYKSSRQLGAMRSQVRSIEEGLGDDPRHYVFQSNLMRSFQNLQSSHHRFEFSAAGIEAQGNFRIDAAGRSARGLRRRSRARIGAIDERLQQVAARRAREQHTAALLHAEEDAEGIRAAFESDVIELVALQEELIASAGVSEEFLRNLLTAEAAENRLKTAREDLKRTEGQVNDLAAKRHSEHDGVGIELLESGGIVGPINVLERLRLGGIGALVTLLAVGMGQWWFTRRG